MKRQRAEGKAQRAEGSRQSAVSSSQSALVIEAKIDNLPSISFDTRKPKTLRKAITMLTELLERPSGQDQVCIGIVAVLTITYS